MTVITDLLNQIIAGMSITGIPSTVSPGVPFTVGVAPPLQPLTLTSIVQHPVAFDLIAKNVSFEEENHLAPDFVTDSEIRDALPVFNLATIPPQVDSTVVPGLIGKLTGQLPVPEINTAIPQMVKLQWTVLDENGDPAADGFIAPLGGLNELTATLTMLPQFEEFTGQVPAPRLFSIRLTGTLTLAGESVPFTLGPVPFLVPVIPLPQVLALSLHKNFQGAALIVVRANSGAVSLNTLRQLLEPIRNALRPLSTIVRLAEMLTGIDVLVGILEGTNVVFFQGDKIDNLNNIDLIKRGLFENDTEAEDELSSFVFVAPPGAQVAMCNDRHQDAGEGRFVVTTGLSFVALCRDLHTGQPVVQPGDATLDVTNAADDWNTDTFGDELSSIKFL
jgi:hypothetical protein